MNAPRRQFLGAAVSALAAAAVAGPLRAAEAAGPAVPRRLRAAPATVPAAGQPALDAWTYEGTLPGPLLRMARGDWLDVELVNDLPDPTTIHWHGLAVPNAMDGVPDLTQPAVAPGARHRYRFPLRHGGTYWYHPHWGTPEQVERGLAGVLVVEDDEAPAVDAEHVWLLDDWRLDGSGRIAGDFYDDMDASHAGRLGNVVTVNAQPPAPLAVRAGERVRLRLVNSANARIFALRLAGPASWIVALDGAPLDAPRPWDGPLLLGPGMRVDVILDAERAGRYDLVDVFGRQPRPLTSIDVDGPAAPVRRDPPAVPVAGARPEPDLDRALRVDMVIGGGMMSMGGWPEDPWTDRLARRLRRLGGAREASPAWTINGRAHGQHRPSDAVEFGVSGGRTVVLAWDNRSAWWHPMHLHGHHFRVLTRNGRALPVRPWRDTVLLAPRERVEVAFVADNPGRWLIHCHVLEHHAAGMGTVFEVGG